jgi:hypothetical protein
VIRTSGYMSNHYSVAMLNYEVLPKKLKSIQVDKTVKILKPIQITEPLKIDEPLQRPDLWVGEPVPVEHSADKVKGMAIYEAYEIFLELSKMFKLPEGI